MLQNYKNEISYFVFEKSFFHCIFNDIYYICRENENRNVNNY